MPCSQRWGQIAANVNDVAVTCERAQWTWMGGSKDTGEKGVYGTRGVEALGNTPGARSGSAGWTDNQGNPWLFGGNPTGDKRDL